MALERQVFTQDLVEHTAQSAFADFFRVLKLQGAGGCVAGIGEKGIALQLAFVVQGIKGRERHVNLSADFKIFQPREPAGRGQGLQEGRNAGDGFHIARHHIAYRSISPGQGPYQAALLVGQADGCSIKFQFAGIGERTVSGFADALVKRGQFVGVVCVSQRKHRVAVPGLFKFPQSRFIHQVTSDGLGRGIRGDPFRVFLFQALQLHHEQIILKIRDFRHIQNIVVSVVPEDLATEFFDSLLSSIFCHRHNRTKIRFFHPISINSSTFAPFLHRR